MAKNKAKAMSDMDDMGMNDAASMTEQQGSMFMDMPQPTKNMKRKKST